MDAKMMMNSFISMNYDALINMTDWDFNLHDKFIH